MGTRTQGAGLEECVRVGGEVPGEVCVRLEAGVQGGAICREVAVYLWPEDAGDADAPGEAYGALYRLTMNVGARWPMQSARRRVVDQVLLGQPSPPAGASTACRGRRRALDRRGSPRSLDPVSRRRRELRAAPPPPSRSTHPRSQVRSARRRRPAGRGLRRSAARLMRDDPVVVGRVVEFHSVVIPSQLLAR